MVYKAFQYLMTVKLLLKLLKFNQLHIYILLMMVIIKSCHLFPLWPATAL